MQFSDLKLMARQKIRNEQFYGTANQNHFIPHTWLKPPCFCKNEEVNEMPGTQIVTKRSSWC